MSALEGIHYVRPPELKFDEIKNTDEYIEYTECADSGGMGYKLTTEENPFEDKAADCL